eukprot:UN27728
MDTTLKNTKHEMSQYSIQLDHVESDMDHYKQQTDIMQETNKTYTNLYDTTLQTLKTEMKTMEMNIISNSKRITDFQDGGGRGDGEGAENLEHRHLSPIQNKKELIHLDGTLSKSNESLIKRISLEHPLILNHREIEHLELDKDEKNHKNVRWN